MDSDQASPGGSWFGPNFKAARTAAGISQGEVVARMVASTGQPYTQQALSKIELGHQEPTLLRAQILADIVGADLAALTRPPEAAARALAITAAAKDLRFAREMAEGRVAEVVRLRGELAALINAGGDIAAAAISDGRGALALRFSWEE